MANGTIRRWIGASAVAALMLTLSACLLSPGKFISELDVRENGDFSFSYVGELVFQPLMEKPGGGAGQGQEFEPASMTCYAEEAERPCTAAEIAEHEAGESQRKIEWEEMQEENRKAAAEREKQQTASAKSFLGGIDTSDPRAGEELAEKLRRQAGWSKVEYRGNGVFHVEFRKSGALDHDFTFPTIEGFAMANTFVQLVRRNDGTLRINAPGFGPPDSPMGMGGMAMMSGGSDGSQSDKAPKPDGSFTIRTNAGILANNTDEGPQADPAGQRLDWQVSPGSTAAPTALLKLSR